MKIRDRIQQLKAENFYVEWQEYPLRMVCGDKIRIYESANALPLCSCDVTEVNAIPKNVLDMEFEEDAGIWLIHGTLSFDMLAKH